MYAILSVDPGSIPPKGVSYSQQKKATLTLREGLKMSID